MHQFQPADLQLWRLHERDGLDVGGPLGVLHGLRNCLALRPLYMHTANRRVQLAHDRLRPSALLLDNGEMPG